MNTQELIEWMTSDEAVDVAANALALADQGVTLAMLEESDEDWGGDEATYTRSTAKSVLESIQSRLKHVDEEIS